MIDKIALGEEIAAKAFIRIPNIVKTQCLQFLTEHHAEEFYPDLSIESILEKEFNDASENGPPMRIAVHDLNARYIYVLSSMVFL